MNNMIKEIYKINNKTKFACGVTIVGELFVGIIGQPFSMEYYKFSEENKKFVIGQWEAYKNFKW